MRNWIVRLIATVFLISCGEKNNKTQPVNAADAGQRSYIDSLGHLVKQSPDSTTLRIHLINSLDSLHLYEEAISQTDSLIKKDSLNNELWVMKAQLQEDKKDTAAAVESYINALNIYPSAEVQLNLANLFAESRNRKALLICDNVRKMSLGRETDADCHFITGVFYARTGDYKKALQAFDNAINQNYTLMEAYMEKGFIYYEGKNFKEALKVFETAITVNNMYADAWYWKAKCYQASGNKSEAIINYQRSLDLDKQLREAGEAIKRLEKS
jgi:tetratricopeptide (TPR) repeat protein